MRRAFLLAIVVAAAVACGTSAANPQGADGGQPPPACPAPFAECDGMTNTVCETRLDVDPMSCGACGKACPRGGAHQTATCEASTCGLVCERGFADCDANPVNGCEAAVTACGSTVSDLVMVAGPGGIGLDADFVYYGSKGTPPDFLDGILYKIPKSGGVPTVLATGLNRPIKIVVAGGVVYWANGGAGDRPDGSISFVGTAGGPIRTIASAMTRPNNPIVAGPLILWTTREVPAGRILSARRDGTTATPTVVADMVFNPTSLALVGTKLVWTTEGVDADAGSERRVEQSNIDGSERVTLAEGIPAPSYQLGLATDGVFVGSRDDGSIRRVPFDTTMMTTIVAKELGQVLELLLDNTTLYAVTGAGRRVVAVPATGGAVRDIAVGQVNPTYLAADSEYLYWMDGPLTGAATLRRAKKSGS